MTGQGIICALTEHIAIEGADKIVRCNIMGETVITQKSNQPGTIGILFDCESQLSHEFCRFNNLYMEATMNANGEKGYMSDKRRVRAITLRGVKCSAFWVPLDSVAYINPELPKQLESQVGLQFNALTGVEVVCKYMPPAARNGGMGKAAEPTRHKTPQVQHFKEHIETDQFGRNKHKLDEGGLVIVTEKLHGTSCRVGYLEVKTPIKSWWAKLSASLSNWFEYRTWFKLDTWEGEKYQYVVGSRRVLKTIDWKTKDGRSFYSTDLWRDAAQCSFDGKLRKGETIYFEIVGYEETGKPIMSNHSTTALRKFLEKAEYNEWIAKYGENITYSYGQEGGTYGVYIYRITTTNEDGVQYDLSWSQVLTRAKELGVKTVPTLAVEYLDTNVEEEDFNKAKEDLVKSIELRAEQHSILFPSNPREGVCVRIENGGNQPILLKQKAYAFKVLEGIVKDNDNAVDIEEEN